LSIRGSVSFTHDPALTWPNPSPAGVSSYDSATRTTTWDFSPIPFLLCGSIQFEILIPEEIPMGSTIVSEARVFPMLGDLNSGNNQIVWTKVVDANSINKTTMSHLESGEIVATDELKLYPNEPSPFLSETLIRFNLPKADEVTLKVYDMNGRLLMSQNNSFTKGINEIIINSGDIPEQGVLFYKIETSTDSVIGKMFKL